MIASRRAAWFLQGRGSLLMLAAAVLLLPLIVSTNFHYRVLVLVWVFSLAVIGLNLLMGYAGQVSLGHAGFFALGAYSTALGPPLLNMPPWASLPAGIVLSALVAFVIGRPILRLKGHYLAVATLGFGVLVYMALSNEIRLTGGPDGMRVERLLLFGWSVRGNDTWYWITGGLMLLGAWLALNLVGSPSGRAIRAIHDSEVAASALGIDAAAYKLLVFVISAAYASAAGGLLALFNGHVTPGLSDFLISVQFVTMVVLGGMGSILGSVVGAALLVLLPQILTFLQDYEHAFLGLIMILTMIFLRSGLVPGLLKLLAKDGHEGNP
jgi:branched-chain amino acid transport system permease protein